VAHRLDLAQQTTIPESLWHEACWDGATSKLVPFPNRWHLFFDKQTVPRNCITLWTHAAVLALARGALEPFACKGNTCRGGCAFVGARPHVCRELNPAERLADEVLDRLSLSAPHVFSSRAATSSGQFTNNPRALARETHAAYCAIFGHPVPGAAGAAPHARPRCSVRLPAQRPSQQPSQRPSHPLQSRCPRPVPGRPRSPHLPTHPPCAVLIAAPAAAVGGEGAGPSDAPTPQTSPGGGGAGPSPVAGASAADAAGPWRCRPVAGEDVAYAAGDSARAGMETAWQVLRGPGSVVRRRGGVGGGDWLDGRHAGPAVEAGEEKGQARGSVWRVREVINGVYLPTDGARVVGRERAAEHTRRVLQLRDPGITRPELLVAELWLRLRLAAAPLLCWLNACCGLWMTTCTVPALLTHDP